MTARVAVVEEVETSMIGPEALRDRVFAAVPTPFHGSGEVHREGLDRLIRAMASTGLGGVAVGTAVGRGPRLSPSTRSALLSSWRDGLGPGRLLIASVGPPPEVRRPPEVFEAARSMAREAFEAGADLILVDPPGALRGRPDRDSLVLAYHSEVAGPGLPILVSCRREAAGGIAYGPEVLAQLLARPEVLGVEVATFDGIATFQQVEALVRELAPTKLVVSGEERFLGYSLISGAGAAIVGMACAFPGAVLDLMDAHASGDAPRFLKKCVEIDRLARAIFVPPMEGVALRLSWALVQGGTLPFEAAYDPWGPRPGRAAFERLGEALAALDPEGPWHTGRWPDAPA